jgi:hypothetical protein
MWLRLGTLLLAAAFQVSFTAKNPETLRQRYGNPLSETFLVRPDIAVSASYGATGQTCELVIKPNSHDMIAKPGSDTIDDDVLLEIEDELIPKPERGKHIMDTFLNTVCLSGDNCAGAGVQSDWQNIMIYRNAAEGKEARSHYERIRWKRAECRQKEVGTH